MRVPKKKPSASAIRAHAHALGDSVRNEQQKTVLLVEVARMRGTRVSTALKKSHLLLADILCRRRRT